MSVKATTLILSLFLFVSAKSFTSGYLVIVGGGTSKAVAETYEKKLQQTMWYQSTHQEGLSTLLLSDTISGLNKGFHIAVAGIVQEKAYAVFIQQLLLRDMEGVYFRPVTLTKAVQPIEYTRKQPVAEYILSLIKREENRASTVLSGCDTLIIENGPYCEGGMCDNTIYHTGGKVVLYHRYWGGDHGGEESVHYYSKGKLSSVMTIEDRSIYKDYNPNGPVVDTEYDTSWVYYIDGTAVALKNYENLIFTGGSLFKKELEAEEEYLQTVLPFVKAIHSQKYSYDSKDTLTYGE